MRRLSALGNAFAERIEIGVKFPKSLFSLSASHFAKDATCGPHEIIHKSVLGGLLDTSWS